VITFGVQRRQHHHNQGWGHAGLADGQPRFCTGEPGVSMFKLVSMSTQLEKARFQSEAAGMLGISAFSGPEFY
jgi:hypothetical protein